jgi:hypothetical protein
MRFFKDNGLSLVLLALFAVCLAGQSLTGWYSENEDRRKHDQSALEFDEYLESGHFWESTAENWESEFLQMAAFVILSGFLVQRGSAESKKPDDEAPDDEETEQHLRSKGEAPWPVRKGGAWLAVYNHSLSLTLGLLFLGSFIIHAIGGHMAENEDLVSHGEAPIGFWEFTRSSTFWFQSFQNWQSEFLSVGVLVILTIFLRERGSSQSKPVAAPHRMTGAS